MNERTQTILIALATHRPREVSEETGRWRTLCWCGWLGDDTSFAAHQAGAVDQALSEVDSPLSTP